MQAPLHRNANVSACTRRSVSVDYLQQRIFLLARQGDLAVKTPQCLRHRRHIRLEVYGFNGAALRSRLLYIRVSVLRGTVDKPTLCESKVGCLHISTLAPRCREANIQLMEKKRRRWNCGAAHD